MTKAPRLATNADMIGLAATEGMAKSTIGTAVLNLARASKPVTWAAIVAEIEAMAEGRETTAGMELLAKGALEFIAALPHHQD